MIAEELPANTFERHLLLKQMLPPASRGGISVLARTPEEFEGHLPSLYLDIALDGQILCDPRGYAAQRLAATQQLMTQAGLYRIRTPAGDAWRWRTKPRQPWVLEWKR